MSFLSGLLIGVWFCIVFSWSGCDARTSEIKSGYITHLGQRYKICGKLVNNWQLESTEKGEVRG